MAIDYAVKYSGIIDERFRLSSVTASAVNNDYDFVGVRTVKIYSVSAATMNNYASAGANRYGVPAELDASSQEISLTRDRSFTFTIDRRNSLDTGGALDAGKALARQIDEVLIPEMDVYRISAIATKAGGKKTAALTASNAYSAFLEGTEFLAENRVPLNGRVALITPKFLKMIKQDPSFVRSGDVSQEMLLHGQVGQVDGVPLVLVPGSYMPTATEFIIASNFSACGPVKLAEYKIHDNPPGINGWLVEGRVVYDCFVPENKKNGLFAWKTA